MEIKQDLRAVPYSILYKHKIHTVICLCMSLYIYMKCILYLCKFNTAEPNLLLDTCLLSDWGVAVANKCIILWMKFTKAVYCFATF